MDKLVFGLKFDPRTTGEIANLATDPSPFTGVRLVCTANVDHISNLKNHPKFRQAYKAAYLVTADGMPVFVYANARGAQLSERVTGSDLFPAIMNRLDAKMHRPALLASTEASAQIISNRLREAGFSDDNFLVVVPKFGFERSEFETAKLVDAIRDNETTHLFMGVGSPKSEIWIDENRKLLGNIWAFGFGTALDYYAGTATRAPTSVQKLGLEWLWRLMSDPKRLARRYLLNSWGFFGPIFNDLRGK